MTWHCITKRCLRDQVEPTEVVDGQFCPECGHTLASTVNVLMALPAPFIESVRAASEKLEDGDISVP